MGRTLKTFIISFIVIVSVSSIGSQPVWSLEPITDAMLDKAESNAKDVIARAEAAGNSIARAIGEQALKVIQALRETIHSSIGEAKDAYLESQQKTFDNVNLVLDQVKDFEKVSLTDITTLTATLSDEVSRLPFVNHAPAIMLYQPRVVVPQGPPTVPIHVIGPKLAESKPMASVNGVALPLQRPREVELIIPLDRKTLKFDKQVPQYQVVNVKFDQAQVSWWNPVSWFRGDVIQRDLSLMLLPEILATVTIETKLNSFDVEKKVVVKHAGGHGKDAPMDIGITLDPPDKAVGWKIDVDQILADKGLKFKTDSADGGSSCTGLLNASLTPESFTFRLQHGHKTGDFGNKSDADVQCSMTVPAIKKTPKIVDGPTITEQIGWTEDVKKDLPKDLASYELSIRLFDSKKYIINKDNKVPLGVVEITRGTDSLIFRPKPPADF